MNTKENQQTQNDDANTLITVFSLFQKLDELVRNMASLDRIIDETMDNMDKVENLFSMLLTTIKFYEMDLQLNNNELTPD